MLRCFSLSPISLQSGILSVRPAGGDTIPTQLCTTPPWIYLQPDQLRLFHGIRGRWWAVLECSCMSMGRWKTRSRRSLPMTCLGNYLGKVKKNPRDKWNMFHFESMRVRSVATGHTWKAMNMMATVFIGTVCVIATQNTSWMTTANCEAHTTQSNSRFMWFCSQGGFALIWLWGASADLLAIFWSSTSYFQRW